MWGGAHTTRFILLYYNFHLSQSFVIYLFTCLHLLQYFSRLSVHTYLPFHDYNQKSVNDDE